MGDYDPYDANDLTDAELVEMALGNPAGEPQVSMRTSRFNITKVQAHLISDALAQYDSYESDVEREVAQRTERIIRERFDLE